MDANRQRPAPVHNRTLRHEVLEPIRDAILFGNPRRGAERPDAG